MPSVPLAAACTAGSGLWQCGPRVPVGLEFRAVIAARRVTLEALTPAWLDDWADVLFRRDPFGSATLDLTLKWSHPSAWLLNRFAPEMYAAALRGADNALSQLLIATLHQHPGYTVAEFIGQLQHNKDTLWAAAEDVPALLQQTGPTSRH